MPRELPHVKISPEQLRAARALLNLSRAACGKLVGISAETLRNIEQEKFTPSPATVEKIIKTFSELGVEFFTHHGVALRKESTTTPRLNSRLTDLLNDAALAEATDDVAASGATGGATACAATAA